MPVLGAYLHVVKRIADVGVSHFVEQHGIGIVGFDRDQLDALVLVVIGELLESASRRAAPSGQ